MPAELEVQGDRTLSGKESLRLTGGLTALHTSLALAGGLVPVLRAG